jgi:hypothetical protein
VCDEKYENIVEKLVFLRLLSSHLHFRRAQIVRRRSAAVGTLLAEAMAWHFECALAELPAHAPQRMLASEPDAAQMPPQSPSAASSCAGASTSLSSSSSLSPTAAATSDAALATSLHQPPPPPHFLREPRVLGMINGGFVRGDRSYAVGHVLTIGDIMTELPFPREAVLLRISAGDLYAVVEQQVPHCKLSCSLILFIYLSICLLYVLVSYLCMHVYCIEAVVCHPPQLRGVPLATGYHPHFARSLALTFDSSRPPGARVLALHAFGRLIERPAASSSTSSPSVSAAALPLAPVSTQAASSASTALPVPSTSSESDSQRSQPRQDYYLVACTEFMAGGGDEIAAFRSAQTLSIASERTRVAAVLIRYLRARNAEAKANAMAKAKAKANRAQKHSSHQNADADNGDEEEDDDDDEAIVSSSMPSSSAVSVLSTSANINAADGQIEVGLGSRLHSNGDGNGNDNGECSDDECLFEIDGRHPTHMVDVAAAF